MTPPAAFTSSGGVAPRIAPAQAFQPTPPLAQILYPLAAPLAAGGRTERSAVPLDDERRIRALAKQIKRLISDDIRRGIGLS